MTSIKWGPKPFIYTPPPVIYGCFELTAGGDLSNCLKELFFEITSSLYQAYDIKSYLKVITEDCLINVNNYTEAKKSTLDKESI
ncbi:hypothetical protein GF352_00065 [archaeon]|nr:hypothetical protein [archaeon]